MELFAEPLTLWLGRGIAVALGGAAGFAYYKFIGCRTGVCPITSNPWISTLYGAFVGGLMFWK